MPKHLLLALALLTLPLLAGCDFAGDDADAVLFNGTWEITQIQSRTTDYSSLLLARYSSVVIAFVAEERDFSLLLDVKDSPQDILFEGRFRVDSDDREIDLTSNDFPRRFDFDYLFEDSETVVLRTDEDEDAVLATIFGIQLDVDEISLVMRRN